MPKNTSPQSVIDSYRKRQQMMPFLVGGLAVLLVAVGVIIIVATIAGNDNKNPSASILDIFKSNTETPTVTITPSATPVTPTLTPTLTVTITVSPTVTITPTLAGPFEYTVQEGDTCWDIAAKYNVNPDVLLAINNFGAQCPIQPGKTILVPGPNQKLPTNTPIPSNLQRGTKVDYTVQSGDTLASIASALNSTVEDIMRENKITDANKISAGQVLKVSVNLVTRTPTFAPTSTPLGPQTAPTHSSNPPAGTPAASQGQPTQPGGTTIPTADKPAT